MKGAAGRLSVGGDVGNLMEQFKSSFRSTTGNLHVDSVLSNASTSGGGEGRDGNGGDDGRGLGGEGGGGGVPSTPTTPSNGSLTRGPLR